MFESENGVFVVVRSCCFPPVVARGGMEVVWELLYCMLRKRSEEVELRVGRTCTSAMFEESTDIKGKGQ